MYDPDSEVKLILITATALILLLAAVIVAALLIQQKRKFQHKQQLLHMQGHFDKELLKAELTIQGETFRAISKNLHDNIGSSISTAMLLLYKDETMTLTELENNRTEAISILDKSVDDLKNIARSLNPDYLNEIGLSEAMNQRLQQLERTKKYQIAFNFNEAPKALQSQKQVIMFYIFQEAINNINLHAHAKKIIVNLCYQPEELTLMIKDDGTGIAENTHNAKPNKRGSGLLNMKNHADMMNAQLVISSKNGQGTEITLTVPQPY